MVYCRAFESSYCSTMMYSGELGAVRLGFQISLTFHEAIAISFVNGEFLECVTG